MRRYAKSNSPRKADRANALRVLAEALASSDSRYTRSAALGALEHWRGAPHPSLLAHQAAMLGDLCYPST